MAKPTTTKVITNTVRLSFVHLLEKAETLSGDLKYGTQLWIPMESQRKTRHGVKRI